MASQWFLALAALLLAVAVVEARSKYDGRMLKISGTAPPGPSNNAFTITNPTGADVATTNTLFAALTTPRGGTITLQFNTLTLSRGLTCNYNYKIQCAGGFTCILDCSLVTYTECLSIHGGATVILVGVTFDGKGVNRTAPLVAVGGSTTATTLSGVTVTGSNFPPNGSAIEVDGPTTGSKATAGSSLKLVGGTAFSGNTKDITVFGTTKVKTSVTSCYASGSAGNIPVIAYSGTTTVTVCSTAAPTDPPAKFNNTPTTPVPNYILKKGPTCSACPS